MTDKKDAVLPATADPDNLYWVLSENKFMYLPTRTLCERGAVMRQVGGKIATMIEKNKVCSNLFWAPGAPTYIENKAVIEGIMYDFLGNSLLNTYKAPELEFQGTPDGAGFWLELGEHIYGDQWPHIVKVLAFKTQHPDKKVNHALVWGSYDQGIGKDLLLAAVQPGIGAYNLSSITAGVATEWSKKGFTAPILKNVIVRISEVHDMGVDRFRFYDMTKDWAAAPPEYIKVADKNVKAYHIANVVLPIYSTNHKTDSVYWEPEDRRNYFAWSDVTAPTCKSSDGAAIGTIGGYDIPRDDERKDEYFRGFLYHLEQGAGYHVAAYLSQPELIAGFNPGAPPPQTAAWRAVIAANRKVEDTELLDLLDKLGTQPTEPWDDLERPDVVTIAKITAAAGSGSQVYAFFSDPKNSRAWGHRIEKAGYKAIDNPVAKDGLWRVAGRRQVVYARRDSISRRGPDSGPRVH